MSRIEEIKLVSQCVLTGDKHAFGKLVEAYQQRVRRFFLNLTMGDEDLTDDLSQETFIKAYLNIANFKGLSSFSTWLFRIGYNEFYSYVRARHEEHYDQLPDEGDEQGAVNQTDARLTVQKALNALNRVERAVVVMFYIEDMPIKKISNVMQIPQGTIKSHLHRAKDKMAKYV
ncbi:MAG: RNA polymerase sigma factor [Muribaculaceae bacterium]|nr:RNA polymerase sigma factor [Muribaculaceae bacterium]